MKKVKMFLVKTLLNLVVYVRDIHSKNTEAPFPIHLLCLSTIGFLDNSFSQENFHRPT